MTEEDVSEKIREKEVGFNLLMQKKGANWGS
jgi:hypothetical protein